jgi:hypothetical protein
VKRTYEYDAYGNTWQVAYSESVSSASSRSNVESDSTVRTEGPGVNQYTMTRTVQDTDLNATLRWSPSTSPGVTGYTMTAFVYNGTQSFDMGTAGPNDTSASGHYDASVINYGAQLSMVTQTSYGWTARGNLSNVVRC